MLYIVAETIYLPLSLSVWRAAIAAGTLAGTIAGYYLLRWLRRRLVLRAQQKLTQLHKPHKAEIISRALAEIERLRAAVQSGQLPADRGAQQISLTTRSCYDALMNHTTAYQARYEVGQRRLQAMLQMLDSAYPAEFSKPTREPASQADFNVLCDQATEVVQSCN